MHLPETNQAPTEEKQVRVLVHKSPIEPADLVILTICVVVTFLRAEYLVASREHWYATREHQDCHDVSDLTVAKRLDVGIVGITLHAAIPAEVIVDAITVVFAVRLVVLLVEGNQVAEGKTVVTGHEIDAIQR